MSKISDNPWEVIINQYRQIVSESYPNKLSVWPLLSGYDVTMCSCKGWNIFVFLHTANHNMVTYHGIGELPEAVIGAEIINESNRCQIRSKVAKHFRLKNEDGVILIGPDERLHANELVNMLHRHEHAMGLTPMMIFLSHKGADKEYVRQFKLVLNTLGFLPWLDEDSMTAGVELDRAILKGFQDSCAAVFFITPNFVDETFLATEIDYAIAEKRKKGNKFSIITLVIRQNGRKCIVPELLHRYVWKEPSNDLQALNEILLALPIQVGEVYWR